jgi:hypothetical protein
MFNRTMMNVGVEYEGGAHLFSWRVLATHTCSLA